MNTYRIVRAECKHLEDAMLMGDPFVVDNYVCSLSSVGVCLPRLQEFRLCFVSTMPGSASGILTVKAHVAGDFAVKGSSNRPHHSSIEIERRSSNGGSSGSSSISFGPGASVTAVDATR